MATNFPASLDTLTNPTSSDSLSSPSHSAQHANVNDAVEAIETALLDGAPLHIDDANERVGVGNVSPSYKLDVTGDINATGALRIGGTAVGEWDTWTPAVPNAAWGAIVNGTITALYAQVNDVIHYYIDYTFGSSDSVNNGWGLTPPVNLSTTVSFNGGCYLIDANTGNRYHGMNQVGNTDRIRPYFGDYGAVNVLTGTFPITWATGDQIRMWGTVRVA